MLMNAHYPTPELTDSAKALRQGWDDLADQKPTDHTDPVAWQIHALRGTILQATEALICAYQEATNG